jgi:uncharacterized membrane protein (UPF0182 family)
VIPIEDAILYVSPLYLRAERGQIPELKRVIAAYGDQVVMEETLPEALAALFRPRDQTPSVPSASRGDEAGARSADPVRQALSLYHRAMERLKAGDWVGFGAEMDKLREFLESSQRPSRP